MVGTLHQRKKERQAERYEESVAPSSGHHCSLSMLAMLYRVVARGTKAVPVTDDNL